MEALALRAGVRLQEGSLGERVGVVGARSKGSSGTELLVGKSKGTCSCPLASQPAVLMAYWRITDSVYALSVARPLVASVAIEASIAWASSTAGLTRSLTWDRAALRALSTAASA
jgi:hypothetical protein